jgi:hypothetical protein
MSSQIARATLLAISQGPEARRQFILDTVKSLSRRTPGKARAVLQDLVDRS